MAGHSFGPFLKASNTAPCGEQFIHTQLSSPSEQVLGRIKKNDILDIRILEGKQIIIAFYEDEIVGVIINKDVIKLMTCMLQGFKFFAVVRSIYGGMCAVTIKSLVDGENE